MKSITYGKMIVERKEQLIAELDRCVELAEVEGVYETALKIDEELENMLQECPEAFESYEQLTSCFYDCQQCPYYEKDTDGCCSQCEEITGRYL